MRLASIVWKRDPYNIFDRLRPEALLCREEIKRRGGVIKHQGVYVWRIDWPEWKLDKSR